MSDIDPSDITIGRRPTPEKFNPDSSEPSASQSRSDREGLPQSYRMRADPHYVEQLASRREREAARLGAATGESGERDAQAGQRERRSDRVLALLNDEIAAIGSAVALLGTEATSLSRNLSVDLIRAQAWRASWLLRASALIDQSHRSQVRPRPVSSLLEAIRQGLAPECRLSGVTLQLHATDWNQSIAVDEPIFIAGITGGVFATIALLGPDGGTVRVSIDSAGGELRAIDISQDDVAVVPAASLRYFDQAWTDRPGGWPAWLAAATAKNAAQQHGGSAVFLPGDRRGSALRLNFARTH